MVVKKKNHPYCKIMTDTFQVIRDYLNRVERQREGTQKLAWKIIRNPVFMRNRKDPIIATTPFDRHSQTNLNDYKRFLRSIDGPADVVQNIHATHEGIPDTLVYFYFAPSKTPAQTRSQQAVSRPQRKSQSPR